jgi:antagonist of KipI
MDPFAARIANILVGNSDREAVIEAHFPAPEIHFTSDTIFSTAGADLTPLLDGIEIRNWQTFRADAGSILTFGSKVAGSRCYIAASGGFDVPQWLGSSTTNLAAHAGGFHGRKLAAGDVIEVKAASKTPKVGLAAAPSIIPRYHDFPTVMITAGPEFERLTTASRDALINSTFVVGKSSDQMGFRLEGGPPLQIVGGPVFLSSAVAFGTIQLPPGGDPIVLMSDHQTTGGYPRICNVIAVDIPLAAQLGPGDRLAFHLVEQAYAHKLLIAMERDLAMLRTACRLLSNTRL